MRSAARSVCLVSLAALGLSTTPASSQDLFSLLFGGLARPQMVPAVPYYDDGYVYRRPVRRHRVVRRKPVEAATPKMPLKAKDPSELINPVPLILTDSTLRRGDVVVFPDGPREFRGGPGSHHRLADFVPLRDGGKKLLASNRAYKGPFPIAQNEAWSVQDKVAQTRDIDTTGSVRRASR